MTDTERVTVDKNETAKIMTTVVHLALGSVLFVVFPDQSFAGQNRIGL